MAVAKQQIKDEGSESLFKMNMQTLGLNPAPAIDPKEARAENDDNAPHSIKDNQYTREKDNTGYYRVADGRAKLSAHGEDSEEQKQEKRAREVAGEMRRIAEEQRQSPIAKFAEGLGAMWKGATDFAKEKFDQAKQLVGKGIDYVGDKATQLANFTIDKVGDGVAYARETASGISGNVKSFFARFDKQDAPQMAKAEKVDPNASFHEPDKTAPTPSQTNIIKLGFDPGNVFSRAAQGVATKFDAIAPDVNFNIKAPAPGLN